MINTYIRIGFIVNENEYDTVCSFLISQYQNNKTTIVKKDNYCLINNSFILIRVFKYINDEDTISLVVKSGRYILIILSNKIKLKQSSINLLKDLCNLRTIWSKEITNE